MEAQLKVKYLTNTIAALQGSNGLYNHVVLLGRKLGP